MMIQVPNILKQVALGIVLLLGDSDVDALVDAPLSAQVTLAALADKQLTRTR